MKIKPNHLFIKATLLALLILQSQLLSICAQGTAFAYQGRLNNGGVPASGSYDFQFAIFKVDQSGIPFSPILTNTAVLVTNGLFTTTLDFGPGIFTGTNLWLDISVRPNGGGGGFSTLSPRQALTATPYAIFANAASNVLGTVAAAQVNGPLGNGQLANSSINVTAGTGLSGGGAVVLGGTTTLNNAGVLAVAGNSDITASTTGGTVTLGSTGQSADIVNALVKRDYAGGFSTATISVDGGLNLPATTSATTGVIYLDDYPILHAYGSYEGAFNFFAGLGAGNFNLTSINNTGVGNFALQFLTSGHDNTALGRSALQRNAAGLDNTGLGSFALNANLVGSQNTAVGYDALAMNTNGSFNSAIGFNALTSNTSGNENTAHGSAALTSNTTGIENTAIGDEALFYNINGSDNTALGDQALLSNTNGNNNIALGHQAGYNLQTGNYNIDIGNSGVVGDANTIRIGTIGIHTNIFIAGVINGNGGGLTNLNATQINPASALVINSLVVSNAQITGTLRSGSETGTAEAPSPAGLIVRRINSTQLTSNSIVAVVKSDNSTNLITLVRDGSTGGFQIKYPASPGYITIASMGIDNTGAAKNFYTTVANPGTAGLVQIYTNAQNVMHFECTFGITYDSGRHLTQVTLSRYAIGVSFDNFWSGNIISTYNQ